MNVLVLDTETIVCPFYRFLRDYPVVIYRQGPRILYAHQKNVLEKNHKVSFPFLKKITDIRIQLSRNVSDSDRIEYPWDSKRTYHIHPDHPLSFSDQFWNQFYVSLEKHSPPHHIKIPLTIHFMWIDPENDHAGIPKRYRKNMETFRIHNPDFQIQTWTYHQLSSFMTPNEKEKISTIPNVIERCDVLRMMLLSRVGGIYSDLDFYCVTSLRHLLLQSEENDYFVYEPHPNAIFNGFFATVAGNPFISQYYSSLLDTSFSRSVHGEEVLHRTGPKALYRFHQSVMPSHKIHPPDQVLPMNFFMSFSEKALQPYVYTLWHEGSFWYFSMSMKLYVLVFFLVLIVALGLYFGFGFETSA